MLYLRHKINNDPRGLFKVVINNENNMILGATLYGKQSEELINIIKLAIDQNIILLRDNIYTHPTMAESFNDLFKPEQNIKTWWHALNDAAIGFIVVLLAS